MSTFDRREFLSRSKKGSVGIAAGVTARGTLGTGGLSRDERRDTEATDSYDSICWRSRIHFRS